jgi:peptide/nickel transport system substrate-binding protein
MLKRYARPTLLLFIVLLALPTFSFAQDSFYQQAPMLAERVAADELPPVDERLPNNPVLITPIDREGIYGGTWDVARIQGDYTGIARMLQYEGLVRWNVEWTGIIPNLAQSFEVSADSTTFTFHLRQGTRWSDGAPFTADDIMFWYQDIFLNEELRETHRSFLNGREDAFIVEKQDDYTVVFRFNQPYGAFLQEMATMDGSMMTFYPKHYLSQFHPTYNPDIDALIAEAGVATWVDLLNLHRSGGITDMHPGTPALFAWIFEAGTVISNTPGESFVAVRNPYYWKIDTAFQQLPYIDQVRFNVVEDANGVMEAVLAGRVDMQDRHVAVAVNDPANKELGGYNTYQSYQRGGSPVAIFFNQTAEDPVKHEVLQNRDFRIGLSYAINREAMIEATGLDVQPAQAGPDSTSIFYDENFGTQYLEYDPSRANQYLDQAGYSERNADGIRLGPDGNPITLQVNIPDSYPGFDPTAFATYVAQMLADWRAVGIDTQLNTLPRLEFDDMSATSAAPNFNQYDVMLWAFEGAADQISALTSYVPLPRNRIAPLWGVWYSDPSNPQAVLPSTTVQEQFALHRQLLQTADRDEQNALLREIVRINQQEFWVIGTTDGTSQYGVVRSNFHNVPEFMFFSWTYPNPAPTNPSQYFIDPQDD